MPTSRIASNTNRSAVLRNGFAAHKKTQQKTRQNMAGFLFAEGWPRIIFYGRAG